MMKVCYSELDGPEGLSCRLEAAGHAGFAPAGQDIVCAGASTLMQALVYLLAGEENAHADAWEEPDGPRLAVQADAPCAAWVQGAFELAKAGFTLLAERYPDNIRFADVSRRGEQSMMDLQMFAEEAAPAAPALSPAQARQAVASGTMEPGEKTAQPVPEAKPDPEPTEPETPQPVHSEYANSDSIAKIEKKIKRNTNIQDVLYRKELIDAVNDNIRNISLVLLALAVVLTFISFALINNTIRLAIYSKRFLIHTMKLVGASWGFIRGPFLRKNVWSGVLAAVVADTVLMGTAYWAVTYEPELLQVITPEVMLIVCASVLVFGIVITWLCAYVSINKYLRMRANSLYYI